MNILIFSPILSHPQNEGSCKRIFALTKYLQTLGHTIHFVYFTQSGLNRKSFELMLNEWDSLTIIDKTISYEASSTGYELDEWYQDNIHTVVNGVIETFNVEAVLVNYIIQSKLLEYVPNDILKIIDTLDIFANRHTIYENKNCRPYTWYSVSKSDEIKALNRADMILAIQNEEADYFRSVVDVPVKLINHLESNHFLNRSYSSLKKIGFIGSGNHINDHSMNEFLNEYFKHSVSNNDIQIVLAGKICDKIKIDHPNIVLMGIVEDLEDFYGEVDLIINPLTFGTGLKIKSIEALSYGVPIISTKIGFEGINSQNECHQFDTLLEMVECIEKLYTLPKKLEELALLSKEIFIDYDNNVKQNIEELFIVDKGESEKLENREIIMQQLYNQNQLSIFNNKENEKLIKKKEELQKSIKDLISIRFISHPIKKYKQYKKLLRTYYNIK